MTSFAEGDRVSLHGIEDIKDAEGGHLFLESERGTIVEGEYDPHDPRKWSTYYACVKLDRYDKPLWLSTHRLRKLNPLDLMAEI